MYEGLCRMQKKQGAAVSAAPSYFWWVVRDSNTRPTD